MMMVAILVRPWLLLMQDKGIEPRILADDIMIITAGKKMLQRFIRALDETHKYLIAIGARTPNKRYNFASKHKAAQWLQDTWWEVLGAKVPVLRYFRYLGVHINTRTRRAASTSDKMFDEAKAVLAMLENLLVDIKAKANAIKTVVFPAAMYGIEVNQATKAMVATLAAAVNDCLYRKTTAMTRTGS